MKKALLLLPLLFVLLYGNDTYAQCSVDQAYADSSAGLYPDALPNGVVGEAYEQVIQLVLPRDTVVAIPPFPPINAAFCSFTLDSIPELGDIGLSVACNTPDCSWTLDHTPGVVNQGCAVVAGTPTQTFDDSITVYVSVIAGDVDANPPYNCSPLSGIPPELLAVVYKLPFKVTPAVSIDDLNKTDLNLSLFPNPTMGNANLKFTLTERAQAEVNVYDLVGRKMLTAFSGNATPGEQTVSINTETLPAGIYLVELNLDKGASIVTERLVVNPR